MNLPHGIDKADGISLAIEPIQLLALPDMLLNLIFLSFANLAKRCIFASNEGFYEY